MLSTVEESRGYDFQDPENAKKWRGLFVGSLRKVLEQVHPSLTAEESALEFVESLCLRLLATLCAHPSPLCVQDVEERVARTFPTPIDKWALCDARDAAASATKRRKLLLPQDRLHQMLQKEVLMYKIDTSVSVFMTAILEYVSTDILRLAGHFVKKISAKSGYETITSGDIKTAMCADKVLLDMFYQESLAGAVTADRRGGRRGSLSYAELARDLLADEKHFLRDLHLIIRVFKDELEKILDKDTRVRHTTTTRLSLSYAELARDLLADEKHFLRDLHLIIRVFKDELEKILDKDTRTISLIFGNIVDIYELTVTLLGNLEDAMEMSQDSPTPYIGSCFEGKTDRQTLLGNLEHAMEMSQDSPTPYIGSCFEGKTDRQTLLGNLEHAMEMSQDSPTPYIGSCFEDSPTPYIGSCFEGKTDRQTLLGNLEDAMEMSQDSPTPYIGSCFEGKTDRQTLLGNLEDAMEMSQDSPTPYIGSCFEELAEVEEFRAYVRYANIVTRKESRDALQNIVAEPAFSERLDTAGHGFRLAVKYYLPKLLLAPVAHVFLYHSYVLAMLQVAPATDDRESFKQVECNLHPIKKLLMKALGNGPKIDMALRMAARARRQLAIEKCNELARLVDNWDKSETGQCCNEFIREDTLSKIGPGKRIAERRAYLFDGLLLLCKPITSIVGVAGAGAGGAGGVQQLKLKEKLHVRKLELVDRPDSDEAKHCLELLPRAGPPVILACASCQEKRNWMCDLVMLNTKPMLDRSLDSILLDLEKRHPLKLPPPELYRFAVPDSSDNIRLEERQGNAPAPLIKGATLLKLVERLTYHIYADLNLVRTFLTTYRSFCLPSELLGLLIERFHIPDPSEVYETHIPVVRIRTPNQHRTIQPATSLDSIMESIESVASDAEKLSKNTAREDWKRYRKEFQQPVKFRVINVLRHWVDQHFYDFEREPPLLERLRAFLESVDGRPMRKWVQSVLKTVQRKSEKSESDAGVSHVFSKPPPRVISHVANPELHNWHPLALHPLELARQLTLREFQLYRQVKPSELVGAVWTKKDKEKTSPNLLKIIKHTTNFTRWMEKWIVESENLEERVGVVCRFLELGCALRDLNNFNGVLCVAAAAGSASVHRLRATFQMVPPRLLRHLEEFRELNSDHFRRYQERLRSINPPCVPFFGMYLTNILHIEEGNRDFLPDSDNKLINFSKRRKVAEITGEIQQYQNQPYCLTVEPKTRAFLEALDPFPGLDENEVTNYLYAKSLEIEPRPPVKQMPKFPRKYPELSLKPVKVSRRQHAPRDSDAHNNNDDTLSVSQLSPTSSVSAWDGASVSSLSLSEHRGSRWDDGRNSLVSPRLERSASNTFSQLSLFDKGLALFDKAKSSSRCEEPPSPRAIERHSPRHERTPLQPPGSGSERKPALSPRGPLADAAPIYHPDLMLERVPPLLPRNSTTSNTHTSHSPKTKPEAHTPAPEPERRPPPSPLPARDRARLPGMSPKRSPAPAPPSPPASAFSFPSPAPAPAPATPTHEPVSGGGSASAAGVCGTPPPLPPRRPRDQAQLPTPLLQPSSSIPSTTPPAPSPGGGGSAGARTPSAAPPPLPPRPAPAPALLRPAHSAILQRRHNT
ncbi:protein son of sevenless-like [Cydia amplana]|uniref:protein son of sevenless-like n=1 Tax=Cydia amplana TaxID=1869771 RepID=UPI002FE52DAD